MEIDLKAPFQCTRVVSVDFFTQEKSLVGDYDVISRYGTFLLVDKHNERRKPMDERYYAYNDNGVLIRSPEDVARPGISF